MADGSSKTAEQVKFGQGWLTDIWYFAGLGRDLKPGRLRRVEIVGQPVLLGRGEDGKVFGLRDVCPHRAAPLSAGRMTTEADGAQSVECPFHGWRFRTDTGACAAIPSLTVEQKIDPARMSVRSYFVRESQGLMFVWIAGEGRDRVEPDCEPPVFPGVVGGGPKIVDEMIFDAHVDHAVVGLMDPAHGPYVHQQWWWRSKGSQHDKAKQFGPAPEGFAMLRHAPSKNSRAYVLLGGAPQTEITFRLPGLRWEHVVVGKRQVLSLTCLTPVTENKTRITQLIWSDHPAFLIFKPALAAAARTFLRQDAGMVKLQNQGLQYDPPLMWVDDADTQAKWYAQLKREKVRARAEEREFENPVPHVTLRWRS